MPCARRRDGVKRGAAADAEWAGKASDTSCKQRAWLRLQAAARLALTSFTDLNEGKIKSGSETLIRSPCDPSLVFNWPVHSPPGTAAYGVDSLRYRFTSSMAWQQGPNVVFTAVLQTFSRSLGSQAPSLCP